MRMEPAAADAPMPELRAPGSAAPSSATATATTTGTLKDVGPPGDTRMPFLAHLFELRRRLRNAGFAYLLAFFALSGLFGDALVALLARPLFAIWRQHQDIYGPATLNFSNPIDPFWIEIKLSAIAALFVASPVIFYQLWRFVAPGLYRREKRVVLAVLAASVTFFVGGALFGYFVVFPLAFNFFLSYSRGMMGHVSHLFGFVSYHVGPGWQLRPMLMLDEYAALTIKLLLIFGCVFELPLVLMVLAYLGIVTPRKLLKLEKWALLLSFIAGAIVAPDVVTQTCVALPLFGLYNLAILGSWALGLGRKRPASKAA